MTIFNSRGKNVLHYLTMVAFRRMPIFKSDKICSIFIETLEEIIKKHPFKLIAYVIMPDHVHLIINPQGCDISLVGKELKGLSAKKIIAWLKENEYTSSLEKLRLGKTQKRNHAYAVWQKGITSVDIWSHKFIVQKMGYIHMNPVRAGLCDHPAKWKWSSYHAYLPVRLYDVPIEVDRNPYWNNVEGKAVEDRL